MKKILFLAFLFAVFALPTAFGYVQGGTATNADGQTEGDAAGHQGEPPK